MERKEIMNNPQSEFPGLEEKIKKYRQETNSTQVDLSKERLAFLHEAQKITHPVTKSPKPRHSLWITNMMFGKENRKMVNMITSLVVLLALLAGGTGTTVVMAQSSLPDDPLYSVKLISEDIRQVFALQPEDAWQLRIENTTRRMEEIQALIENGKTIDETVAARYRNQVDQALGLALNLSDEDNLKTLQQTRQTLHTQEEALDKTRLQTNNPQTGELNHIENMLQVRLRILDEEQQLEQIKSMLQQMNQEQDLNRLSATSVSGDLTETSSAVTETEIPDADETAVNGSGFQNGANNGQQQKTATTDPALTTTCTPLGDGAGAQGSNQDGNGPSEQPVQNNPGNNGAGNKGH